MSTDNVINFEERKAKRKADREEFYKNLSVPTLKAFRPDCYYINPELGQMIHCLFLTDKSDLFDREMIYVMEDPVGQIYCAVVDEDTCIGWHELTQEVFHHEVLKHRYNGELPPIPDPPPKDPA